jgi:acyl-CoA reductase-like NAD-dependent aldehyde dehydrogenase
MSSYPVLKLYIGGEWKTAEGAPVINHLVASSAETPFGGVKDSGIGREGGVEGLQCYTVVKNVSYLTA